MNWTVVPAREFAQHAARWQRLHAAGAASPLLAFDFVQPLLDVFGTGRELLAWHGHGEDTDAMTIVTPGRPASGTRSSRPRRPSACGCSAIRVPPTACSRICCAPFPVPR